MNLSGMNAVKCCEMILEGAKLGFFSSEELHRMILMRGGKYYKASNIERRCRESLKIRRKIIKANGSRYAIYGYVNNGRLGELI